MSEVAQYSHLNVFTVEEYEREGETARSWTRIGVAFPHSEGPGFNIELKAYPRDGKLVVLPPNNDAHDAPAEAPAAKAPEEPPPARAGRTAARGRRR